MTSPRRRSARAITCELARADVGAQHGRKCDRGCRAHAACVCKTHHDQRLRPTAYTRRTCRKQTTDTGLNQSAPHTLHALHELRAPRALHVTAAAACAHFGGPPRPGVISNVMYSMLDHILSHHITSCHIASCQVASYHITWRCTIAVQRDTLWRGSGRLVAPGHPAARPEHADARARRHPGGTTCLTLLV